MKSEALKSSRSDRSATGAESAAPLWDEDALIARLVAALECAEHVVRRLDAGVATSEDAAREQCIADTAVLLLSASNVSSYAAIGPRVERIAASLLCHARTPQVLRRICLEPARALEHATAHICLKRLNFYDAEFDAMLDLSVAALSSDGREQLPHQIIEQEWLKQGWLYPEGLPRLRAGAHMAHCALARTMDLFSGTRQDVQSFTRAMMVLRDFNLHPRPLPRARETLLAEAEGMLARCLAEEDYQLAAELLMAWPLTGAGWSPVAAFCFRVVMAAPQAPEDRRATYTMGLLAAACLAPGRRPLAQAQTANVRRGVCSYVLEALKGIETVWINELRGLSAEEREPLASFLVCVALQRAFARREFGVMECILAEAKRFGLTPCPTGLQAAEMVVRLAQYGLGDSAERVHPQTVETIDLLCEASDSLLNPAQILC